jgi:hypothetical protein
LVTGSTVQRRAKPVEDAIGSAVGGETGSETVTAAPELRRGGGDIDAPLSA